MKELTQDQKDLLEKINKCCIEIAKKNNYNIKFDKIEFLEKKDFTMIIHLIYLNLLNLNTILNIII